MIYLAITNILTIVGMTILCLKFSSQKNAVEKELLALREKNDQRIKKNDELEGEKISSLTHEISKLRKEKEEEMKIRFNVEKQIDLTLQKIDEVQKRLQNWQMTKEIEQKNPQVFQENSQEILTKIEDDLYQKIKEIHQVEIDDNHRFISKIFEDFSKNFEKFSIDEKHEFEKLKKEILQIQQHKNSRELYLEEKSKNHENKSEKVNNVNDNGSSVKKVIKQKSDDLSLSGEAENNLKNQQFFDPTPELLSRFQSEISDYDHALDKDYFTPESFSGNKVKLFCDVAFCDGKTLYLFDFKSCRYFAEYNHIKDRNRKSAESLLEHKFAKYFDYLGNHKYVDSAAKLVATKGIKFDKKIIVIVLPSAAEIEIVKRGKIYEKAKSFGFEILGLEGAADLTL